MQSCSWWSKFCLFIVSLSHMCIVIKVKTKESSSSILALQEDSAQYQLRLFTSKMIDVGRPFKTKISTKNWPISLQYCNFRNFHL